MNTQAGTMLHPAAELRNAPSMTASFAAGRHGLLHSLASGAALDPSTTWGLPSDRHLFSLTSGISAARLSPIR